MDECVNVATRDLHLDGVELSWHDSFRRPHCTREDFEALASRPGRGDAVLSAHVWDNIMQGDAAQAGDSLLRWLALCEKTDVNNIVIHGGAWPDQKEGIARAHRVFESVLPAFEREHVVLNLENHYPYEYKNCQELFSQPWEFLQVLKLDSPSLRFCFDTGHGNMNRNTPELLEALAPWLNYVHFADNHGVDDDHVAYGKGTVDWQDLFARLGAIPATQVCCIEFPVDEDKEPLRACVAEIRRRWPVDQ